MQVGHWKPLLLAAMCAALFSPSTVQIVSAQAVPRSERAPRASRDSDVYDRGYREGERQGEHDARRGRSFSFENDPAFRNGDRGYNRRFGSRDDYRDQFRAGFADGYRSAYERIRGRSYRGSDRTGVFGRQAPRRGYQEPAFARGYAHGYQQGLRDGGNRDRYDPVGSRDYRNGDQGYDQSYGSRDAYKDNYRAGFRQGYEDGYRDGTR